jgi:hypothetical protein
MSITTTLQLGLTLHCIFPNPNITAYSQLQIKKDMFVINTTIQLDAAR